METTTPLDCLRHLETQELPLQITSRGALSKLAALHSAGLVRVTIPPPGTKQPFTTDPMPATVVTITPKGRRVLAEHSGDN